MHVLAFVLLFQVGCSLKETESLRPNANCPNAPVAAFSMNDSVCVAPCTITFTNNSSTGGDLTYQWDFKNGFTSEAFNPSAQVYSTPGQYEISLTVTNSDSCSTIARKALRVRRNPLISVSGGDAVMLGATQRPSSLDYHCLYLQGSTIKSLTLNAQGQLNGGSERTLFSDITSIKATDRNGGFIVTGKNGTSARIGVVNSSQQIATPNLDFQFQNSSSSVATGANSAGNDYLVTGYRKISADNYPAFTYFNVDGTVKANRSYATVDKTNYIGLSVIQKGSNEFLIATRYTPNETTAGQIIAVNAAGDILATQTLSPVAIPSKIIAINNGFAVIGKGIDGKYYVAGLDVNYTVIWSKQLPAVTEVRDVVKASDNNLIVCGQAQDGKRLYLAKVSVSGTHALVWEKHYEDSAATLTGVSIGAIPNSGGYIVAANHFNTINQLYILLIDEQGNEKN
ncbi:MAG: PKD domain-containing protein [Saprospiraceae bacterium]|nr:PKD domain-containing protein [Saprospiraceae bacterium]